VCSSDLKRTPPIFFGMGQVGTVWDFSERTALGSRSRLGEHRIAKEPARPIPPCSPGSVRTRKRHFQHRTSPPNAEGFRGRDVRRARRSWLTKRVSPKRQGQPFFAGCKAVKIKAGASRSRGTTTIRLICPFLKAARNRWYSLNTTHPFESPGLPSI